MKIEEKLNYATQNKYNFSLKNAELDSETDICVLEFFYDDGTILSAEDKNCCQTAVEEYLPQCYKYTLKFIKNYVEKSGLSDYIAAFFATNFPSIKYTIKFVELESGTATIEISGLQQEYVQGKNVSGKLADAVSQKFKQKFAINFIFNQPKDDALDYIDDAPLSVYVPTPKTIEVTDITPVIGEEILVPATYIRDSVRVGNFVTICGKLTECAIRYTKPKKLPDGLTEEQAAEYFGQDDVPLAERLDAGQKIIFKFKLEDFTGSVVGNYFAKKEDYPALVQLSAGMAAIMQGNIVENKFTNKPEFRPTKISLCALPQKWEEEIDYLTEKPFYEFIKPQPIVQTDQVGFFSLGKTQKVAPYLLSHQVVVFDFETTGLNPYQGDKIVEIGAVKLVNGVITEQFQTMVDPKMPMPEKTSQKNHIYDEDLVGAPTISQAMQDFYKFTRGCVLSGYNIVGFDNIFLNLAGRACRYNFDNPVLDCYPLAQKSIKSVKNYKLGTIAKFLGVELKNAHRALADTIATAEVLIKLADNIDE